jgi:cyclohexa-1,5-dienecarbonyl-CoA hydratase
MQRNFRSSRGPPQTNTGRHRRVRHTGCTLMNNSNLISMARDGDTATLVLQRPPLNMLTLDFLRQFEERLDVLAKSAEIRVLILDTEIPVFCAGLDPSELEREKVFLLLEQYHRAARLLCGFPRPTIALVRGMALGAGNELAACCDFVYASEKASFGHPEIKIGSMPSLAPILLPPLIGGRRALEMIMTGRFLGAKEAERIGLIHRAVADDQLTKAADELIGTFRSLSTAITGVALQSTRTVRMRDLDEHIRETETLYLNDLMEMEDAVEGVRAFIEKRSPQWKNR